MSSIDLTDLTGAIREVARTYTAVRQIVEFLHPITDTTSLPDGPALAAHTRATERALSAIITGTHARRQLLEVLLLKPEVFDAEERTHQSFMLSFEEARAQTWAIQLNTDPKTLRLRLLMQSHPTQQESEAVWEGLSRVLRCWKQFEADHAIYQDWMERARADEPPPIFGESLSSTVEEGQTLTLEEAYATMSEAELRTIRAFAQARRAYQDFKQRLNTMGDAPSCGEVAEILNPGNTALHCFAEGYGALCWGSQIQQYVRDFPAHRRGALLALNESASMTHIKLAKIATAGLELEARMADLGALPLTEQDSRQVLALLLQIADLERRGREDRRRFQQLAEPKID